MSKNKNCKIVKITFYLDLFNSNIIMSTNNEKQKTKKSNTSNSLTEIRVKANPIQKNIIVRIFNFLLH